MANLDRNLRELRNRIGKQPLTETMKAYEDELNRCYTDTKTKQDYITILNFKIAKLERELIEKDKYIEELEGDLTLALERIFIKK